MLDTIFQSIGYLAIRFLNFFKNNVVLNNDIESCCLINDDTTTYSE